MLVATEIRNYLATVVERTRALVGEDLLDVWLIGSRVGVRLVRVAGPRAPGRPRAVPAERERRPGPSPRRPARPRRVPELLVGARPGRRAAGRRPLAGRASAADVLPEVPPGRVRRAIRESLAWHDGPDAGAPNRRLDKGEQGGGPGLPCRLPIPTTPTTWRSAPPLPRSRRADAPTLHHGRSEVTMAWTPDVCPRPSGRPRPQPRATRHEVHRSPRRDPGDPEGSPRRCRRRNHPRPRSRSGSCYKSLCMS